MAGSTPSSQPGLSEVGEIISWHRGRELQKLTRTMMPPLRSETRRIQTSPQHSTIKARLLSWVATTYALSSVAIAALLWASPSRALPFSSTPTWSFASPTPAADDYLGGGVALSGNSALIGAFGDNSYSGAAYLYDVTTGSLLQSFINPSPDPYDVFGISVALSGNSALIGSEGDNNSGAAYLFDVTNGSLLQTFTNPTPAPDNRFGASVALSGNSALIGSEGDNSFSGAAYVYASTSSASSTQSQSVPGPLPLLGLGAAFAWSRRLRNKYRNAAQSGARRH